GMTTISNTSTRRGCRGSRRRGWMIFICIRRSRGRSGCGRRIGFRAIDELLDLTRKSDIGDGVRVEEDAEAASFPTDGNEVAAAHAGGEGDAEKVCLPRRAHPEGGGQSGAIGADHAGFVADFEGGPALTGPGLEGAPIAFRVDPEVECA